MIKIDHLECVPWKNGRGVTRTLAIHPPGAGYEDFIWRVSVADVSESGGFSVFSGIDRILVLLSGNGMRLTGGENGPVRLDSPYVPFCFRGEERIHAELLDGATHDLNVMARRGVVEARVEVWRADARLAHSAEAAVFLCPRGSFLVDGRRISTGQALRRSNLPAGLRLVSEQPESVLIAALIRNAAGST